MKFPKGVTIIYRIEKKFGGKKTLANLAIDDYNLPKFYLPAFLDFLLCKL